MKSSDIPSKFQIPFANAAGGGYIRNVPTASQIGIQNGAASLTDGFPPLNFLPVGSGGVPPFGQDMNGILKQATAWNRWQATGSFPPYDPAWQTSAGVNGYPSGACVASLLQQGLIWLSIVEDNITNPDTGGAGWISFINVLHQNVNLYVNAATGNDNNNGLSAGSPKATIQAAIDVAWGYGASQYTVTINIADGTYAGSTTPVRSGPSVVVTGNAANPSNVVVSSGSDHCFTVLGPNAVTIQNLKVQTGTGGGPANGFNVASGSTLTTVNTVSGNCEGAPFFVAGATINAGSHRFTGNSTALFWASASGFIRLVTGATYTIANNLTVSSASVRTEQSGSLFVPSPAPNFTLSGAVTGSRYLAVLNGTINTQGAGANYFPGSTAGSTSSGGQYV